MLERYFVKPGTIDRIRASWIGPMVERYVEWLSESGYAARCVYSRVPLLISFGEFARDRGVTAREQLPSHVTGFVEWWLAQRPHRARSGRAVENEIRGPVLQMLRIGLGEDITGSVARGRIRSVTWLQDSSSS
jgi:integrase/recombinase XerD